MFYVSVGCSEEFMNSELPISQNQKEEKKEKRPKNEKCHDKGKEKRIFFFGEKGQLTSAQNKIK